MAGPEETMSKCSSPIAQHYQPYREFQHLDLPTAPMEVGTKADIRLVMDDSPLPLVSSYDKNNPPKFLICPLSGDLMDNPLILVESSQTFNKASIINWLEQGHRNCPVTGMPLTHCSLVENVPLRKAAQLWAEEHGVVPCRYDEQSECEFNYLVAMLEDQLKSMYQSWDTIEDTKSKVDISSSGKNDIKMIDELVKLILNEDKATHQSAALSLARLCWGSKEAQSVAGQSNKKREAIMTRMVYLLKGEIEDGKPGNMAWAISEILRCHPKNQSKSNEWIARACRLVGAWVSGNCRIQNLMLETGIIPLLIECLRSTATIQKLHSGMTLMHISYQNRLTSMQVLKSGALLSVPNLLNSRSLIVRVVGAGIIAHLLNLFDYNWGANYNVFRALVALTHQAEDYVGVLGSAAIFELVNRDKVDMTKLTQLKLVPRILDLVESCNFPGYRRAAHKFLLKWSKYMVASGIHKRGTGREMQETVRRLVKLLHLNITLVSEIAINVMWILLPLSQNYRLLTDFIDRFERLSMDATITAEGRSMSREIVCYVRKQDMEYKTRIQVAITTFGIYLALRIIRIFR